MQFEASAHRAAQARSRASLLAVLAGVAGALCLSAAGAHEPANGDRALLHHIHGLSYSADGSALYVPSHFGLAVWSAGAWSKAPGPAHDYMGFDASRDALYTSGHPAADSDLVNPFGLMKSTDAGRTWRQLGLEGESDFHLLAAGHETNRVWVLNPAPNSRMRTGGLHRTDNDGLGWHAARGAGVAGRIGALAAHPRDRRIVALATDRGVFVSTDSGERFRRLEAHGQATSVHFDLDGRHLLAGLFDGRARLVRQSLDEGAAAEDLALPALGGDAVSYIAQSPAQPRRYAIATFARHVFVSEDAGRTWTQIAAAGRPAAGGRR